MLTLLQSLIKVYQWSISPLLGATCRFVPTCSEYAQQALNEHGAGKGLCLSAQRFCRCHPWGGAGLDPVPSANPDDTSANSKQ